ncbi:MAG: hypothetical protein NZ874_06955, partial [Fimbriimonadales bacterium]|nr:hypothetical protein [Fimbriimonadales bacterium]
DGQIEHYLTGHTNTVNSVAFSPNGQLLASGGSDSIRLWRVSDGQLVRTLTDIGYSVVFSPDGQYLASGSDYRDNTVRLWRVSDGQLVRTIRGHTTWIPSVAFSPDGQYLFAGSGVIWIFRVSDGQLVRTYDQETGSGVYSVQFSPSGAYFAYGRYDATVVLARNPFFTPPGDVDGNGCVDDGDLLRVLFAFGCSSSCGAEDVNRDGTVDDADLLVVLFNFGQGC